MTILRVALSKAGFQESPGRRFKTKFYICTKCGRDIVKGSYCPCQSQVAEVRVSRGVIRRRAT